MELDRVGDALLDFLLHYCSPGGVVFGKNVSKLFIAFSGLAVGSEMSCLAAVGTCAVRRESGGFSWMFVVVHRSEFFREFHTF